MDYADRIRVSTFPVSLPDCSSCVGQLLSFAAYSIVAVTEEVLFRGILFRMIDERYQTLQAFIISSLTFGAVHLMTVDFWTAMGISAEAGFMLAAAYKFRNNLWIPIGIH